MQENPFQAPKTDAGMRPRAIGVLSGQREDLRAVAQFQRGIIFCILIYFLLLVFQGIFPELRTFAFIGILVNGITGTVFTFRLAMRVYSQGTGILLGILVLVPCVGLVILLIVSSKATAILKQNGVHVGLLGANPSSI